MLKDAWKAILAVLVLVLSILFGRSMSRPTRTEQLKKHEDEIEARKKEQQVAKATEVQKEIGKINADPPRKKPTDVSSDLKALVDDYNKD